MDSVRCEEVHDILATCLPEAFLSAYPHFTDRMWALLYEAQRRGKDLSELYAQLSSALFQEMRSITRGSMLLPVHTNGSSKTPRSIYLEELERLADALLEPVIGRYSRTMGSFETLNAFAMRTLSLTALKYLLVYYRNWASPMNLDIYQRVIRENFAPEQYQGWLR